MTTDIINILMSGIFYASTLFLLAAGLQLVFGVQKIFNLACGSLYALGAYTGVVFVEQFHRMGLPPLFSLVPLILAGLSLSPSSGERDGVWETRHVKQHLHHGNGAR